MAEQTDILLDTNFDIAVQDGDIVWGESFEQEIDLIVRARTGEWKFDPVLGCDLILFVNSNASKLDIIQKVKLQLERDGKNNLQINYSNGNLTVDKK